MSDSQSLLFQLLKERIPHEISMVDEVADLLGVSSDSAYRRIRGQTEMTLNEVKILSAKYNISIDSIFGSSLNSVTFRYRSINPDSFDFEKYLKNVLRDIKAINKSDDCEIIYTAKDIPLFYHFHFKELAAFKIFFWLKTFMQFPEYADSKFSLDYLKDEIHDIGCELLENYVGIDSVEIWNDETIYSVLRQIDFYHESGLFDQPDTALILCDKLLELLNLVKKQAEKGRKLLLDKEVANSEGNFKLYYNELTLVDNTVLVRMGENKVVYITHNLLNNLITGNVDFAEETHGIMNNMMHKANLISSASEKLRNKFFIRMISRVEDLKKKLFNKE